MVSVSLIVVPRNVKSGVHKGTTKEVHDTFWIADGELRRRPETAA